MARPAYRGDDKTAYEKLVEAFWQSLEEGTFSRLTVSGICKRTGLNRNSFYYHFEDMDDLARSVVASALEKDLPALMIAQSGKDATGIAETLDSSRYAQKFERVCLVAGSNSTPALQSMLKVALSEIWCHTLDIDLEKLTKEDRVVFEFCLGGVLSLLAFRHDTGINITMGEMLKTDFAQGMLSSMARLSSMGTED